MIGFDPLEDVFPLIHPVLEFKFNPGGRPVALKERCGAWVAAIL
jgi:hypothetical protein